MKVSKIDFVNLKGNDSDQAEPGELDAEEADSDGGWESRKRAISCPFCGAYWAIDEDGMADFEEVCEHLVFAFHGDMEWKEVCCNDAISKQEVEEDIRRAWRIAESGGKVVDDDAEEDENPPSIANILFHGDFNLEGENFKMRLVDEFFLFTQYHICCGPGAYDVLFAVRHPSSLGTASSIKEPRKGL